MSWVLVIVAAWVVLAAAAAVLIAGAVRVADRRSDDVAVGGSEADRPNFVVDRSPADDARTADDVHARVPTPRRDQPTEAAAPPPHRAAPPPSADTP